MACRVETKGMSFMRHLGAIGSLLACFALTFTAMPAAADDYEADTTALIRMAQENPWTRTGYWFEMRNVLGEWEKMMLIFGYADPGDEAACNSILMFASAQNPDRKFRCNAVN